MTLQDLILELQGGMIPLGAELQSVVITAANGLGYEWAKESAEDEDVVERPIPITNPIAGGFGPT